MGLNFFRQFLKHGAGRAATTGTRRHQRRERPDPHGLQNFLGDDDLAGPIAARFRRQRHPDGVADTVL